MEHREQHRARLDEDQACLLLRDGRIVLVEAVPVQLGKSAGALDTGWAAADDDDVEDAVVDQGGIAVGGLPAAEHVRA